MPSRIRSFIAVDIAPAVRFALERALNQLTVAAPDYRWVELAKVHLTLSFLGDVPDPDIPDICRALEQVAKNFEEFELEVTGLGAFPDANRARVIWAGVGAGREQLCALQNRVAVALQDLGFASERETFSPHLTLGRAGRDGRPSAALRSVLADAETSLYGVTSVDEVVLYASYREKTGPNYVPMASFSLAY